MNNDRNSTSRLGDKYRELRRDYLKTARNKISKIRQILEAESLERRHLQRLYELAHAIKGSAGTYDFQKLTAVASKITRRIELYLQRRTDSFPLYDLTQLKELSSSLDSHWQTALNRDTPAPQSSQPESKDANANRIVLIQDTLDEALGLVRQLEHFGYDVFHKPRVEDLNKLIADTHPDAVIIDAELEDNVTGGIDKIKQTRESEGPKLPPVIVQSQLDTLEARLESVRAGADGYLAKPLDVSRLVNRLEVLLGGPEQHRVLIIDDDESLAKWYREVLANHGLKPEMVTDASHTLEAIRKCEPDLILLDLHMPECSGRELAAVIRQASVGTAVPIVFLSAEEDRQEQIACLLEGGNEFITKPIEPAHLVDVVQAHLKHGRQIRRRIRRDSLTGLYNHAETKNLLRHELHRARRNNTPLSLAILDLDRFKEVNDNYGHLVGDSVLRTLGQLCRRRLRRTDTIGRIGGEEFSIIMPDTPPSDARDVVDELRDTFAAIEHRTERESINVTFSFGIADYPDFMHPDELWRAADRALYRAKSDGRNCGAIASPDQSS